MCSGTSPRVAFTYDADGRRTAIDYSEGGTGTSIAFRYSGDAITAEYVGGVLTREYLVDESGGIVKMVIPAGQADPGTYVVNWNGHGDALGLWRIKTDGSLERANTFTYGTWGEPAVQGATNSATGQPYGDLGFRFLYVGRFGVQYDDFGYGLDLHYMRARHYSPEFGRFLQPDPSALEPNLYAYAANAAATRIDPDGKHNRRNEGFGGSGGGGSGFLRQLLLNAVSDYRLKRIIRELYRPNAKIGDGSAMAALRYERRTGRLLSRTGHVRKLIERRTQLIKLWRAGGMLTSDRRIVKNLLMDIQRALSNLE